MGFDQEKMGFDQEKKFDNGCDQTDDKQEEIEKIMNISASSTEVPEDGKAKKANIVDDEKPAASSEFRVCDFCGKKFSSGKALGGHRRYHLQALRKMGNSSSSSKVKIRLPNNSKTTKPSSNSDDDIKLDTLITSSNNNGKPSCCLCKKDFPSKKSLFGHMRSHPERDWRGVTPPFPLPSEKPSSSGPPNSDSIEDNDHVGAVSAQNGSVFDLSKCCLSWLKTDKRGRKSIGGAEAAQNLVYLSLGKRSCTEFSDHSLEATYLNEAAIEAKSHKKKMIDGSPTRKEQIKVYSRASLLKLGSTTDKDKGGESGSDHTDLLNGEKAFSESGYGKTPVKMDVDEEKEKEAKKNIKEMNTEVLSPESDDHERKFQLIRKIKGKKKMVKSSKSQDQSESDDKSLLIKTLKTAAPAAACYSCGLCDKSFPTFQALGGHRSRHYKEMIKNNVTAMEESIRPAPNLTVKKENNESETFSTDQLQAETPIVSEELVEEASTSEEEERLLSYDHIHQELGEGSNQSGSKVLDFDLNEPYVMEDHEANNKSTFYKA